MLVNVSYNNKEITNKINNEVGKPFSLKERFMMCGNGSPKLFINAANVEIQKLLELDNNTNYCNIEMRPKGIIVGFRSLLESYALVIPYYKLTVFKGEAKVYSIYRDHFFIKVKSDSKAVQKFIKKVLNYKINNRKNSIKNV